MTDAVSVLIIDDDKAMQKIIRKALPKEWSATIAEDGDTGLKRAAEILPDLILLDCEMPGMHGYMVCEQLKQSPVTHHIPVMFISSLSGVRDRLQGYEVGADDFLVKPFSEMELQARMRVLLRYRQGHEALSEQYELANQTAMEALRGSGELGMAIQFIEYSYEVSTLDELAARFLRVTQSLGLKASLMFITSEGPAFFGGSNEIPPIEQDLITMLHERGDRFNDFGCRTQINYTDVALLVKNMPLEDPERYGRYKDFLPTMMGTTDAKVRSIETEKGLVKQTEELIYAFENVKDTLINIGVELEGNQTFILDSVRAGLAAIEEQIPALALDEDQERYLNGAIDSTLNDVTKVLNQATELRNALESVPLMLKMVSENQQRLLEKVKAPEIRKVQDAPVGEVDSEVTGEIELF